jgi:hypothetical protein
MPTLFGIFSLLPVICIQALPQKQLPGMLKSIPYDPPEHRKVIVCLFFTYNIGVMPTLFRIFGLLH